MYHIAQVFRLHQNFLLPIKLTISSLHFYGQCQTCNFKSVDTLIRGSISVKSSQVKSPAVVQLGTYFFNHKPHKTFFDKGVTMQNFSRVYVVASSYQM